MLILLEMSKNLTRSGNPQEPGAGSREPRISSGNSDSASRSVLPERGPLTIVFDSPSRVEISQDSPILAEGFIILPSERSFAPPQILGFRTGAVLRGPVSSSHLLRKKKS
jgi:hypothetical protein